MIDRYRRYLSCSREQIVHETGVDELSLFIIYQPLIKGAANALRYTAMHLALNNSRVDDPPAVVHCRIFDKCYIPCSGIDFDNCAVNATREAAMRRTVKAACLQSWAASLFRQGWPRTRSRQFHRHQLTRVLAIGIA